MKTVKHRREGTAASMAPLKIHKDQDLADLGAPWFLEYTHDHPRDENHDPCIGHWPTWGEAMDAVATATPCPHSEHLCDECDQLATRFWPNLKKPVQLCDSCTHDAFRSGWEPGA